MNTEEDQPDEPLENWLSRKPYWQQYIWKWCAEYEALTDDQIAQCYQHLLEDIGVSEVDQNDRPTISLKNAYVELRADANERATIHICEIKNFRNVNALSEHCSFPCSPNLTLIYGRNASGKSGVARLLAKACFSRGERAILPDLTVTSPGPEKPAATFMLTDPSGANRQQIDYELGKDYDELRRFSVFDDRSVLIHLDESNNMRFTPPHIAIFDRVAGAVARLERRLARDQAASRKENPFVAMFLDPTEVSATSRFCMGLSAAATDEQLRPHITFDKQADQSRITEIERVVAEKRKLDIPARKTQLANDKANLEALRLLLQDYVDRLSIANSREVNKLIEDIVAQRVIVERLGTGSFDDDVLKTTGSDEWRALIQAAKALYKLEKKARADDDPTHCLLCHQALDARSTALYVKYWAYLESEAEGELARLVARQLELIDAFRLAKARFPKFLDTDTGVQTLAIADPECLRELKIAFVSLDTVLDRWVGNIQEAELVDTAGVPTVDLTKLTLLADAKKQESIGLVDPAPEIEEFTKELVSIKHRKAVSAVKEKTEEYLNYLRWLSKTERLNFPGIKAALTKKRTEQFLLGVMTEYKSKFNQELEKLGCDFKLVMTASGDQGQTVREYRLEFAEDYPPSHVLSEGEQNVCSLADFLTEAQLDPDNCGIFLDDPVSSLDHERKGSIADRLAKEAFARQVVILTHDLVFMRQLVDSARASGIPFMAHWMRKVDGVPGCVKINSSPKLASVAALKIDATESLQDYGNLEPKKQEQALGAALDYLRSGCEGLVEEHLFGKTIQRYDDHVRIQNLEEAVFDQPLALRIVELHGKVSHLLLGHNRSDAMQENSVTLKDFHNAMAEFDELERDLKEAHKAAVKSREAASKARKAATQGW